jgi:hypothetical protein
MATELSRPVFETQAKDPLDIGADALLFVMAHGHALDVPTTALHFAEKAAMLSIARRDTPEAVLVDVNRAVDTIANTLRIRAKLDAEEAALTSLVAPHGATGQSIGGGAGLSASDVEFVKALRAHLGDNLDGRGGGGPRVPRPSPLPSKPTAGSARPF